MKYSINLRSHADIKLLEDFPVSDVILQSNEFCRSGGIESDKLEDSIQQLKYKNKRVILAWDCLAKDEEIVQSKDLLKSIISELDAIRFIDPGIGSFLQSEFPETDLEFSLEHGYLNTPAIVNWLKLFLPQLKKTVLSLQLPLTAIKSIHPEIPVVTELLGSGPIGIFYSRRSLLPQKLTVQRQVISQTTIASDDRPEEKNPILTSSKGSLVFYNKPLNIFGIHDELEDAGIDYLRLEYLYHVELMAIADSVREYGWMQAMKRRNKESATDAFLLNNPTDNLFNRFKNEYLEENSKNKIGIVVVSVKPRYCLISLDMPIKLPQHVQFISPEGKTVKVILEKLEDLKGKMHTANIEPGVYLTSWLKFVVTGSLVRV